MSSRSRHKRARQFDDEPEARSERVPGKTPRNAADRRSYRARVAPGKVPLTDSLREAYTDDSQPGAAAHDVTNARAGQGQRLPTDLESALASAAGHDLSSVRIHTDAVAARAARTLAARAYTEGQDIYFAGGAYQPGTAAGRNLIAHEVAHTVQQRGATSVMQQGRLEIGEAGSALEREADAFADAFSSGHAPSPIAGRAHGAGLLRRPDDDATATTRAKPFKLPPPLLVESLGDRFALRFRLKDSGGEATFDNLSLQISYLGMYRVRLDSGEHRRAISYQLPVPSYHLPSSSDPVKLVNARLLSKTAGTLHFDVYGDGSKLLTVTVKGEAAKFSERKHAFAVSIDGNPVDKQPGGFVIELPEGTELGTGVGPTGGAAEERTASVDLNLNGDPVTLWARRLGNTNTVLLSTRTTAAKAMIKVPITTGPLDEVTARILVDDGRNIHLDLNGDGVADAHLVHTVAQTDFGSVAIRDHHLHNFAADKVFGGELMFSSVGMPVTIPDDQRNELNPPKTDHPWPENRPPGQQDILGEEPRVISRPGDQFEIRLDLDGDRHKNMLLRFIPLGPPNAANEQRFRMVLIQLSSGASDSTGITVEASPRNPASPAVVQESDGEGATIISFGYTGPKLQIGAPTEGDDGRRYWLDGVTADKRYLVLPVDDVEQSSLVKNDPNVKLSGYAYTTDVELGEFGDKFRLTCEQVGKGVTFGMSALGPEGPVAGFGIQMTSAESDKMELQVEPTRINVFSKSDLYRIIIADRIEAAPGRPIQVDRYHRIRATEANQLNPPVERSFRVLNGHFLEDGWDGGTADRYAAGAAGAVTVLGQQKRATDIRQMIAQTNAGLINQARVAGEHGLVPTDVVAAWEALAKDMLVVADKAELDPDPTKSKRDEAIRAAHTKSAEHHASVCANWLQDQAGEKFEHTGPRHRDRKNKYTGEYRKQAYRGRKTTRQAYGLALVAQLESGDHKAAAQSYKNFVGGFSKWLLKGLEDKLGDESDEYRAAKYHADMSSRLDALKGKKGIRRVPAVFMADDSYSKEANYNQYKQVPLQVYVWREGTEWHIRDVTDPSKPPWKGSVTDNGEEYPPWELFNQLNHKRHFPKGHIRYQTAGTGGIVRCEQKTSWWEWVGRVALIVAAIGLGLALGGIGLLAKIAFAASAILNIISSYGELRDAYHHGYADDVLVMLNVLNIVGSVAQVGSLATGSLVQGAKAASAAGKAYTGASAIAAKYAGKFFIPFTAAELGADITSAVVMTADMVTQLQNIDSLEGRASLFAQWAITGGMTVLAVKGDLPELKAGGSRIIIDVVDGVPVARAAGMSLDATAIKPPKGDANAHASARWQTADLQDAARNSNDPALKQAAGGMVGDPEFKEWYAKWMEQPKRVETGPNGPRARVDDLTIRGKTIPAKVRDKLDTLVAKGGMGVYEDAMTTAAEVTRIRQAAGDLDIDPARPTWKDNRAKLVAGLGGDKQAEQMVARYERARLGVGADDVTQYIAQQKQLRKTIPDVELERVKALYPEAEVYIGGEVIRPGAPIKGAPDTIEVTVVVPDGTAPEMMLAMEQRVNGRKLNLEPKLAAAPKAKGQTDVGLRAKVMTSDQFLGMATTKVDGKLPRYHRIDRTLGDAFGVDMYPAGAHSYSTERNQMWHLHARWSKRGGKETVSELQLSEDGRRVFFDVDMGSGAHAQRVRVFADLPARALTKRSILHNSNRIVGAGKMASSDAWDILRAIQVGDYSKLNKLGFDIDPSAHPHMKQVEWGIGETPDGQTVLIRGEAGAVDWGELPGVKPLAHIHPDVDGNDLLRHTGRAKWSLVELNAPTDVQFLARNLVMPSAEDAVLLAQRGVDGHRVITPFVVEDGMVMKAGDATQPTSKRLEWVVATSKKVGTVDGKDVIYETTLIGEFDGKKVIRTKIWVTEPGIFNPGKIDMRPPANLRPIGAPSAGVKKPGRVKRALGWMGAALRGAQLKQGVAKNVAKHGIDPDSYDIEVLDATDFEAKFRSRKGRAVFRLEDDRPVVYVRPDATTADILDEVQHMRQLADPTIGAKIRRLHGVELDQWDELSINDRLEAFQLKVDIEIDAKQRTLAELDGWKNRAKRRRVTRNLRDLRKLKREVAQLRDDETALAQMNAGVRATPAYLDDPSYLFGKHSGQVEGNKPNRYALDDDIRFVEVPKQGPERSAAYGKQGVKRVQQVGSTWREHTLVTSGYGGRVSIETDIVFGKTVVVTTKSGHRQVYPVEYNAKLLVKEGDEVASGTPLAREKDRQYRLVEIEYDGGKKDMREEIRRIGNDSDGWVQRGSESSRRGALMEVAAQRQIDAELAGQTAARIKHSRGGGGFDDVVIVFTGSPDKPIATVRIREVKSYPKRHVPMAEFTAITGDDLAANYRVLEEQLAQALEYLKKNGKPMAGYEKMNRAQLKAAKRAVEDMDGVTIEVVLGPDTKLGPEANKRSVLGKLRENIKNTLGKDLLAGKPGEYKPASIQPDRVDEATKELGSS